MQASYSAAFNREYGCTEADWLMWLPAAMGDGVITQTSGSAVQHWPDAGVASLSLTWSALSPRVIALASLPRLQVNFLFDQLSEAERYTYMRRFDLYMQRGGG